MRQCAAAFTPSNYRAPGEDPGISELRLGLIDLWKRTPWEPEIWPDYAAPIVRAVGDDIEAVIANFGMIPKAHQPPGKKYLTVRERRRLAKSQRIGTPGALGSAASFRRAGFMSRTGGQASTYATGSAWPIGSHAASPASGGHGRCRPALRRSRWRC